MGMFEKNGWYTGKDRLLLKITNYLLQIRIYIKDNRVSYKLDVISNNISLFTFNFSSLAEAIRFAEEVTPSLKPQEILAKYKEYILRNKTKQNNKVIKQQRRKSHDKRK